MREEAGRVLKEAAGRVPKKDSQDSVQHGLSLGQDVGQQFVAG